MEKNITIVCLFCNVSFTVTVIDFALGGCNCPDCESELEFATTPEVQTEWNKEYIAVAQERFAVTHYRIMLRGEDGMEVCLKNNVPAEYADLVCEGLQTRYTEGQRVFIEPEETLEDLRRMCREVDEY